MSNKYNADLRVSFKFNPSKRYLRLLQFFKLTPILVGENYFVNLKLENLRPRKLTNVTVAVRLWIRINGQPIPNGIGLQFGDLSACDCKIQSTGPHLMREQGSADIDIQVVFSGTSRLTMEYQNHADSTFLTTYDVEPWSSIVSRIVGVFTFVTLVLTMITFLLKLLHVW